MVHSALLTCSITDAPSHSSPATSLLLHHATPSASTVLQPPSPFAINPKSAELLHNIDRMPSNVEIKAAVRNLKFLIQRAKELSRSEGTLIRQQDTFFNVQKGRLKLRNLMDGTGQLIFYERPDVDGPKLSNYSISLTNDPDGLTRVLSDALGVKGVVKKERHLYMVGQTRVHVDTVEGLGHFMELEVVMKDGQSAEEGEAIAHHLMEELGVKKEDLIVGAYMDLLLSDKKG
ncbi:hypothetical protein MATL_G00258550 [Megalops atlanticus]|uniref:CYTH domain-containing protein n=1 Tax=Megalops atlanticus TaxID=7932 RepID=A0A9D3P9R0_MEGAT|nr:hypothetical protein MATL_G00258550 [Megalops atlanticus]